MRSSPDADGACASISWNAAYDGATSMRASASGVNSARCSAGVKEPSHAAWRSTGAKSMPFMNVLSLKSRLRSSSETGRRSMAGRRSRCRTQRGTTSKAPAGKMARGEAGDRARVDPTREEDAERHVAHEVLPHREIEHGTKILHRVGVADRAVPVEVDVPVRLDFDAAVAIREPVAGRELLDRPEDRMRCRDVLVSEVAGQRREVERAADRRVLDERLELGGEDDLVG